MNRSADTHRIDPETLRALGAMAIAYIRPAIVQEVAGFSIHGADGNMIGFAPTAAHAVIAIRENGMEPVSLH